MRLESINNLSLEEAYDIILDEEGEEAANSFLEGYESGESPLSLREKGIYTATGRMYAMQEDGELNPSELYKGEKIGTLEVYRKWGKEGRKPWAD